MIRCQKIGTHCQNNCFKKEGINKKIITKVTNLKLLKKKTKYVQKLFMGFEGQQLVG